MGEFDAVTVGDAEASTGGTVGIRVGGRVGGAFGSTGAPDGAPEGASDSSSMGAGASAGALVRTVGEEAGFLVNPPPVNLGEQSQTPPWAGSTTSSKVSMPSSECVSR